MNKQRVLVVDDNVDAAATLAMLLEFQGCSVRVAHGANEAMAMASSFQPSLALVDLLMPDVDGWTLAPRLAEAAPACRLVALSGTTSVGGLKRSRQAGFQAHLLKPVDFDEVLTLLQPGLPND